jgi:hypothetical protein
MRRGYKCRLSLLSLLSINGSGHYNIHKLTFLVPTFKWLDSSITLQVGKG